MLQVSGSTIELRIASKPPALSDAMLRQAVLTAARAVSNYYGRFPTPRLTLTITTNEDEGHELHGQTYGASRIDVEIDRGVTLADLADNWVLTHEMFHLAFPNLREKHLWMNEGLSTYLEPIARARIGALTPQRVWKDFVEGMPQGLPEPGDQGLDRTHTWGRTYWGGCLYWLAADVQIRQQTQNHKSLSDALRAILDAGGDGACDWPLERVLETGDKATGTTVLRDLFDQMALKPGTIDLDSFWKKLGVSYRDGVRFDDSAPLASIRASITSPQPAPSASGR